MKSIYILTIFDEYLGDVKHGFKNLDTLKVFLSKLINERYEWSENDVNHVMSDIDERWDSTTVKGTNVTISVEEVGFE